MSNLNQIDIAREYVSKGIKVFPCNPKNKAPLSSNGFKDATTDASKIEAWWKKHPNALIGSPDESFVVLDIDDYNLDASSRFVVESIKQKLYDTGIVDSHHPHVRTMSGGTHVYFKSNDALSRKIKPLPQIDLLGSGGYVILPDQTNYHCLNTDQPWLMFDSLEDIKIDEFAEMCEEYTELTKSVTRAVKAHRNGGLLPSSSNKGGKEKSFKTAEQHEKEKEVYAKLIDEEKDSAYNLAYVDYENNFISFEIKDGIYKPTNPDSDRVVQRVNSREKLLDSNGKLDVSVGSLDSDMINRIFHNREIQTKLGKRLGLKIPTGTQTSSMRSILPGHVDNNPSMGVRWSVDGSHLLIRDFSNHYADKYHQVDYNIVRLYCTIKYNTNVPKLRGPEFVIWFTKMLWEAGMIDITDIRKEYCMSTEKLTKGHRAVADAFLDLDALKSLYAGYCGETVFADKFAAAWCGLSMATVNRAKKSLIDKNIISITGEHDCNPNRKDGFFVTKLFKANTKEENMKLNEAITTTGISRADMKVRNIQRVSNTVEKKTEKEVEDRYPDLATVVGLEIGEQFREKVKNFVEDFDLETVPAAGNMFIPILVSSSYQDIETPSMAAMATYFANNFVVEPVEGIDDPDRIVVTARCESPSISKLIEKYGKDFENEIEPDDVSFVVATGLIPEEVDDYDWDFLTLKFNEYLDYVSGSEMFVRHLNEGVAKLFLDGEDATGDDDD